MALPPIEIDPYLSPAATLPSAWHTEPEALARENRDVFGRTWKMAASLSRLDETLRRAVEFAEGVQREDVAICEAVQRGLRSRSYDRGRYSVRRENGVHHFHRLLARYLEPG